MGEQGALHGGLACLEAKTRRRGPCAVVREPRQAGHAKPHTKASPSGGPKGGHSATAAEEKHGQVGQQELPLPGTQADPGLQCQDETPERRAELFETARPVVHQVEAGTAHAERPTGVQVQMNQRDAPIEALAGQVAKKKWGAEDVPSSCACRAA